MTLGVLPPNAMAGRMFKIFFNVYVPAAGGTVVDGTTFNADINPHGFSTTFAATPSGDGIYFTLSTVGQPLRSVIDVKWAEAGSL